MKKLIISGLTAIIIFASMLTASFAANDPTIKGNFRAGIQNSMDAFIKANMIDGTYYMFDAVTGRMLVLKLEALHSGIVKKGNFYVSCADFTDPTGRLVDLDFLVMPAGDTFKTVQSVVHAMDGKKRKYHLE